MGLPLRHYISCEILLINLLLECVCLENFKPQLTYMFTLEAKELISQTIILTFSNILQKCLRLCYVCLCRDQDFIDMPGMTCNFYKLLKFSAKFSFSEIKYEEYLVIVPHKIIPLYYDL